MQDTPIEKRIVFFLSECLGARTLAPALRALQQDPRLEITVLNDGFGASELDHLGISYTSVPAPFDQHVLPHLEGKDLVISGKSYVEPAENDLMSIAKQLDIPIAMSIPDIGGQIGMAKFNQRDEQGDLLLPTHILIADQRTHGYMMNRGIPHELFVLIGHPYFDQLYQRAEDKQTITAPKQPVVTYMDVPFEHDYKRGVLPAGPYSQRQFVDEVIHAVEQQETKPHFQMRLHMQSDLDDFSLAREKGIPFPNAADAFELILRSSVVVSAYSTTLLEALIAGVPAVSYQPWERCIRRDVFDRRIPIAKTPEELKNHIADALQIAERLPTDRTIVYNPGQSLQKTLDFVYSTLRLPKP